MTTPLPAPAIDAQAGVREGSCRFDPQRVIGFSGFKHGQGSDGERVSESRLLIFRENDGEEREGLALEVFTFFDQLVA